MQQTDVKRVELKSRRPRKRKKRAKAGSLTLSKADFTFSQEIRARDKFCQFPSCMVSDPAKLQNSHYIGRSKKATRYDPDNCIALCWVHHYHDKLLGLEYQKQRKEKHGWDGQYTLLMKKRLGRKRFNALLERSKQTIKLPLVLRQFAEARSL